MESLFFHPKIVHVPIALAVLMPLLTGGLLLAWWREWLPRRAWFIALLFQVLLVGSGYLALQTGETDEDIVESVVAEQYIDEHEEAAELFVGASVVTFFLFVGAGLVRREPIAKAIGALTLLSTVVVFGVGYRVGEAGGALVYKHGAASAFVDGGGNVLQAKAEKGSGDYDEDDDD